jgi:hypothetical protein
METRELMLKICYQIGGQFIKEKRRGNNEAANKLLRVRMNVQRIMDISEEDMRSYVTKEE